MAKSNFSAFSKKLKNAEEALGKGRKGRKGLVEVEPGKYAVRFQSIEFGANGKVPFSHLTSIVVDSEDEDDIGLKIAERITFEERSGKTKEGKPWKMTEEDFFAQLCTSLQSFGVDTSELEMDDLEELADQLEEDQPATGVTIVEKNGYARIKWGKLIEDDELPSLEDVLSEDEDEDDDDAEEDVEDDQDEEDQEEDLESDEDYEDEDDTDDDDEDEEEVPVIKGETVKAKPPTTKRTSKYKVKSSNKSKETCVLVRESDEKEFKNVDWSCVVR